MAPKLTVTNSNGGADETRRKKAKKARRDLRQFVNDYEANPTTTWTSKNNGQQIAILLDLVLALQAHNASLEKRLEALEVGQL